MRTLGVSPEKISEVIDNMGVQLDYPPKKDGRWHRFSVRAKTSRGPYARETHLGRSSVILCWHGWVTLITELFEKKANTVETALGRWKSFEEFKADLPRLESLNVGNIMSPAYLPHFACTCENLE